MAAFIARANASIANERYRSEVLARPPKDSDVLMDLRSRMGARVDVRGARSDHYFLEDSRGVRIADFHNDKDQQAYLLRPVSAGRLYLRRTSDDSEFTIPTSPQVVALADLTLQQPRMRTRGAANDAFQSLFALPFGQRIVESFRFDTVTPPREAPEIDLSGGARVRRYTGVALLSVGALGAAAGVYSLESAHALGAGLGASASQAETARTNQQIHSRNVAGAVGFGVAGVAAGAGLLLVLWPVGHTGVAWDPNLGAATMAVHGSF
jgi:hypothetical protein